MNNFFFEVFAFDEFTTYSASMIAGNNGPLSSLLEFKQQANFHMLLRMILPGLSVYPLATPS